MSGWEDLYARSRPSLYRALVAASGSAEDVEDAIQEAFMVALAKDLDDIAAPQAWLFGVALNKLRHRRRRRAIARRLLLVPRRDSSIDEAAARVDLVRALRRLPARDRELLVAKHYLGLTQEEIARHLGVPRGTVSAALSRAAARFRALEGGR